MAAYYIRNCNIFPSKTHYSDTHCWYLYTNRSITCTTFYAHRKFCLRIGHWQLLLWTLTSHRHSISFVHPQFDEHFFFSVITFPAYEHKSIKKGHQEGLFIIYSIFSSHTNISTLLNCVGPPYSTLIETTLP